MKSQTDLERFLTILTGIADYYGKTLSEGVQDLYWNGLREYDLRAVEKALWEHTRNPDSGQFMPKIADVVRNLQGRTVDQAAVAWTKVESAARRVGSYMDVVFDDAVIHRVIADMGGWVRIGRTDVKELAFVAKEFENRYRGYRMRGETPDYPPVLIGIATAHNATQGFKGQEPVLIGDGHKARQVLSGGTTQPLIPMRSMSDVAPTDHLRRIK